MGIHQGWRSRGPASVLVSEVPALSTGSREPASVSRLALRPNLDGLGLGLGHPCLSLGLGLDYNPACNIEVNTGSVNPYTGVPIISWTVASFLIESLSKQILHY